MALGGEAAVKILQNKESSVLGRHEISLETIDTGIDGSDEVVIFDRRGVYRHHFSCGMKSDCLFDVVTNTLKEIERDSRKRREAKATI